MEWSPTQTPYTLISAKSEDNENLQALLLIRLREILKLFTPAMLFSKSHKIHDLERQILEECDYLEDV